MSISLRGTATIVVTHWSSVHMDWLNTHTQLQSSTITTCQRVGVLWVKTLGLQVSKTITQLDQTIRKVETSVSFSESGSVISDSLWPHGIYSPWNSPGQNTGVGSLSLLQHIFPTQGSNPGLPHCRRILYQLSYQGSQEVQMELSLRLPESSPSWNHDAWTFTFLFSSILPLHVINMLGARN